MGEEKINWHPLSVKVEWNVWQEFRRIARSKGLSVSGIVKSLIADYIESNNKREEV